MAYNTVFKRFTPQWWNLNTFALLSCLYLTKLVNRCYIQFFHKVDDFGSDFRQLYLYDSSIDDLKPLW